MGIVTQTIIKLEEVGTKKPLYGYKCKIVISQNGKIIKTYEAVTSNLGIINVRSGFGVTIALIKDKDGKAKQIGKFLSNSTEKSIYHEIKAPKVVIKRRQESLTVFLAGAGMRGAYIDKVVKSFEYVGINNVKKGNYSALFSGFDEKLYAPIDMVGDAQCVIFYNQTVSSSSNSPLFPLPHFDGDIEAYNRAIRNSSKNIKKDFPVEFKLSDMQVYSQIPKNGQFNFIGYSWGGVIASRSALYYANKNIRIHHLVLIGAPIEKNLLQALQNHKNIGKVIIINLSKQGDPIYAGMKDSEIISAIPKLTQQMAKEGEGHFYYASEKAIGDSRRIELANRLYKEGLR